MRSVVAIAVLLAASAVARADDDHAAKLLTTGRASFAQRRKNIERADVIFCKTYIFHDDEIGRQTVELLAAKARAGAKVFVEYDVKGTTGSAPRLMQIAAHVRSAIPPHLQRLADAGVVLIPTGKPVLGSLVLGSDHDKILVTWRRGEPARAILGGMNIGDEYAGSGTFRFMRKRGLARRDTDVEVTGPAVEKAMDRFVEAARRAGLSHPEILDDASARLRRDPAAFRPAYGQGASATFVANDPRGGRNRREIEATYEKLLDETPDGELVTLANAYFLPSRRFRDAMVRAAARGVRFRLLVNAADVKNDLAARIVSLAFRDQLRGLFKKIPESQLEVLEWRGNARRNEGAQHQKIAKFGANGKMVVGSANLDPLSADHNSEAVVVLDHPRVGKQFDALIGRQLREGDVGRLTRETLEHDSFKTKVKGFVLHRAFGRVL